MGNATPGSGITIQERRSADGLDTYVPMILRPGHFTILIWIVSSVTSLSTAFAPVIRFVPMAMTSLSGFASFRKPAPRGYGR